MRRIAITGVPGTGKTTLAEALAWRGAGVVHLNEFAQGVGQLRVRDRARGSFVVDVDRLAAALRRALRELDDNVVFVEGHFAHEMDVDAVVLLRCDPKVLLRRLAGRGWKESKIRENVEAEALDILAHEVLDTGLPAMELDVSTSRVEDAAERVWRFAVGGREGFKGASVGSAHWSLEALPWF